GPVPISGQLAELVQPVRPALRASPTLIHGSSGENTRRPAVTTSPVVAHRAERTHLKPRERLHRSHAVGVVHHAAHHAEPSAVLPAAPPGLSKLGARAVEAMWVQAHLTNGHAAALRVSHLVGGGLVVRDEVSVGGARVGVSARMAAMGA